MTQPIGPLRVQLDGDAAKLVRALKESEKGLQGLAKALKGVEVAQDRQSSSSDRLTNSFDKMRDKVGGLTEGMGRLAKAYVSVQGVRFARALAEQGARASDSLKVFEATGGSIDKLREATQGLIADASLVQKANLAQTMGIARKDFDKLAQVAIAASKKTGQSLQYLFDSIIVGTARQSRLILDNLGIIVSVEKANEKYAKALKKTAKELTDAEKQQAFMNAVFEAGEGIMGDVAKAGANAGDSFDRFEASTSNLAVTIGQKLMPAVMQELDGLSELMSAMRSLVEILPDVKFDEGGMSTAQLIKDLAEIKEFGAIDRLAVVMLKLARNAAQALHGLLPFGAVLDELLLPVFDKLIDKLNKTTARIKILTDEIRTSKPELLLGEIATGERGKFDEGKGKGRGKGRGERKRSIVDFDHIQTGKVGRFDFSDEERAALAGGPTIDPIELERRNYLARVRKEEAEAAVKRSKDFSAALDRMVEAANLVAEEWEDERQRQRELSEMHQQAAVARNQEMSSLQGGILQQAAAGDGAGVATAVGGAIGGDPLAMVIGLAIEQIMDFQNKMKMVSNDLLSLFGSRVGELIGAFEHLKSGLSGLPFVIWDMAASVLTQTEAFWKLQTAMDYVMGQFIAYFEPLVEKFYSLIPVLNLLIHTIGNALRPLIESEAFQMAVYESFRLLAITALMVTEVFAKLHNISITVRMAFLAIVEKLAGLAAMLSVGEARENLEALAESAAAGQEGLDEQRINIDGIRASIEELKGLTFHTALQRGRDFVDALFKIGDSADKIREQGEKLTNVPQGFKVARERLEAISVGPGGQPTNATGQSDIGPGGGNTIYIGHLSVGADDIESLVDKLLEGAEAVGEAVNGSTFTYGQSASADVNLG